MLFTVTGITSSFLVNVPAAIAVERAVLAHLCGDGQGTAVFASRALAATVEGEQMLESLARWYLAVAEWLRGRLPEAERAFTSSIAQWRAAGQPTLTAWACDRLGQVLRAQARLDAALGTYQQALEITAAPSQPALPAAGAGYVGMAEVAYQRNDLDTAVGHVTEGIARCRHYGDTQALATGLATLAWVRQAQGDAAGALDAMGEAGRAAPSSGVTSLLNPVPAQRARLLLAQGDVAAAARWTQQRGLGAGDEVSYQQEREYLVLARVLLARNRPDDAVSLLKRLHAAAVGQGRTGSVIEIRALQALALAALGEENAAVDTLAQALMLGCPQGYIRVFADEGAPMSALLARLVAAQKADHAAARGVPLGCLARLLRAFGEPPAAAGARQHAAAAVPGLVEQLTPRELEILALLAAGTPNPRIAEQLVVSLNTVKKHVSHLLGKLGAANRTEAVTRARELRPDPLASHRRPSRRHRRAPELADGTVVPAGLLRKIPPGMTPSGDAHSKRRLIPSLQEPVSRHGRVSCLPSHVTYGRAVLSRVSGTDSGIRKVMVMRVFVAGGTGVVGRRLVPQLVARGHQVTATTTSAAKLGLLAQLGADGVVMDGLDAVSVGEAVAKSQPDAIVQQMTAISVAHAGKPDFRHFDRWFATTSRLRTEGTDHLLAAAEAAGVSHLPRQQSPGQRRSDRCCDH